MTRTPFHLLIVFLVVFTLQMSLGVMFVAGRGNLAGLVRQPVIWATIFAVFLVATDYSLPAWLDNTTSILGGLTIPLMLITLGVSLETQPAIQHGTGCRRFRDRDAGCGVVWPPGR